MYVFRAWIDICVVRIKEIISKNNRRLSTLQAVKFAGCRLLVGTLIFLKEFKKNPINLCLPLETLYPPILLISMFFASDVWSLGCVLYEMLTLKHAVRL